MTRSVRGCLSLHAGVGTEVPAQGWDEDSPYRTLAKDCPPGRRTLAVHAGLGRVTILSRQEYLLTRNRPDEPDQLPRHGDHRLACRLVPAQEPVQPPVQPLLRLPGDPPHARRDPVVAQSDRLAHPRLAAVM